MSRKLYAFCRTDEFPPVQVTPDAATVTTKQLKDYLLCSDCEGCLNLNGESGLFSQLPALGGPFPLYDSVLKGTRLYADDALALYATGDNPDVDADKLTHFALGIFWKASVHPWNPKVDGPSIDLGAAGEALRLYLLGEAELPSNIALTVTIDSSPIPLPAFHPPYASSHAHFERSYHFFVPGILFNLLIDEEAQAKADVTSITSTPLRPVIVEKIATLLGSIFSEGGANAVQSDKLKANTAKIEALGLNIKLSR